MLIGRFGFAGAALEAARSIEPINVELLDLGGIGAWIQLEHGEVREIQTHYVTELARLAQDLGGTTVRIFTGYDNPASDYSRQWKLIVETLRECAQRAAELGVTLGVQNHHDMAVGWETMRDLLLTVNHPHCKATFDAWAAALQGDDLALAGKAMGGLTVHTTIADYQLRPRYRYNAALVNHEKQTPFVQAVPMGEGFIPYRVFLEAMVGVGIRGTVAYEMCSPLAGGGTLETLDEYARRFLEYVRRG